MAVNHDDLLALLKELQLTETSDQIGAATQRRYQELIDAEATAFIGAGPWQPSEGGSAGTSSRHRDQFLRPEHDDYDRKGADYN